MAEESFLLVNLKEDKAKKLAQVIGNETSRKILDFLSKKKTATETEISQTLQLPISTVHYNIQHLMEAKLIQADEYHYSAKGKEVNHYSLSNKFVIIAPLEPKEKVLDKLKKLLPVAIIIGVVSAGIGFFNRGFGKMATFAAPRAAEMARVGADEAVFAEAPRAIAEKAVEQAPQIAQTAAQPNIALWFLYGAVFAIIVYLIVDIIKGRFKK